MSEIARAAALGAGQGAGLLRTHIGSALRRERVSRGQTLRELSRHASVSLGYLSEIERGQKEASSELLAAICDALELSIPQLLLEVSRSLTAIDSTHSANSRPTLAIVAGDTTKLSETVNIVDAA